MHTYEGKPKRATKAPLAPNHAPNALGRQPAPAEPPVPSLLSQAEPALRLPVSPAVQRKVMLTTADASSQAIHQAAAKGVQTPTSKLPFAEQIQQAFGRHAIGQVQAHQGPEATASAAAMQAAAYATGQHVVFAGTPDLHTAAHEAAHVVQQRGGVQLAGGVGQVGDAYERHADAVAERVVAGRSAEELLNPFAAVRGGGAMIQAMLVKVKTIKSLMGERTIASVEFEGRVPTTVSGSQGDHTVAETLAQQVLISACVGKTHTQVASSLPEVLSYLDQEATALVGQLREKLDYPKVVGLFQNYQQIALDAKAEGEDKNTALEDFLEAYLRLWNKTPGTAYPKSMGLTSGGGKEKEGIGSVRKINNTTSVEGADQSQIRPLAEAAVKLIDYVGPNVTEAAKHVGRAVQLTLGSVKEMEFYYYDVAITTAQLYAAKRGLNGQDSTSLLEAVVKMITPYDDNDYAYWEQDDVKEEPKDRTN